MYGDFFALCPWRSSLYHCVCAVIYSMNNALFFFLNNTLNKRYNLNISYNLSIIDTIALIFEDADTEFALTLVLLDVS